MNKFVYLPPTLALLLGSVQPLFNTHPTPKEGTVCSGTYYKGINSLYVDCFDQIGNLVSQDENHYEFSLEKECIDNMTYASIKESLKDWLVPEDLADDAVLNCCDFYQRTVGYVFSECDSGINAFIQANLTESETSLSYKEMTTEYKALEWNWDELIALMDAYCQGGATNETDGGATNETDGGNATNSTDGELNL